MSTFLLTVLSRTPPWVWAILAALIAVGLLQARDQTVSRPRLLALPTIMALLSLYSATAAFGAHAGVVAAWAAGAAAGLALNQRLALPRTVQALPDGRWAIAGSWAPLGLLMLIFWMRYLVAASLAVLPTLATHGAFATGCSALYGMAAGLLAARALRVLRHRAGPAAASPALA